MFGLLPALTGEALPGARPVVAEGNLLRRGPVIFRIPPVALRAVRVEADVGDPACEQLMLDLHRCGLFDSENFPEYSHMLDRHDA